MRSGEESSGDNRKNGIQLTTVKGHGNGAFAQFAAKSFRAPLGMAARAREREEINGERGRTTEYDKNECTIKSATDRSHKR